MPRPPQPGEQIGPLLSQGATAEIYGWDDTHVIKLFRPEYGLETAQYEERIARLVEAAGLKAPAVVDMIQFEERVGLVYERADGQQAIRALEAQLWRLRYFAREMARLHASIHQQQNDTLPSQKSRLRRGIEEGQGLDDATKNRLLEQLEQLPDGSTICHGDFHMENILLNGEDFVVIDWIDAVSGHPLGDVARSYIIMTEHQTDETGFVPKLLNWGPRRWFRRTYLHEYFRLRGGSWSELAPWLPVVAAARLRERAAQGLNLVSLVHQWLDE
ncbi:MAG: phosphotransferase [Chloroflexi bacterium]|nr:phosphotransferase [Chloroflexota bacterium]